MQEIGFLYFHILTTHTHIHAYAEFSSCNLLVFRLWEETRGENINYTQKGHKDPLAEPLASYLHTSYNSLLTCNNSYYHMYHSHMQGSVLFKICFYFNDDRIKRTHLIVSEKILTCHVQVFFHQHF